MPDILLLLTPIKFPELVADHNKKPLKFPGRHYSMAKLDTKKTCRQQEKSFQEKSCEKEKRQEKITEKTIC